jgi:hypothetical protein
MPVSETEKTPNLSSDGSASPQNHSAEPGWLGVGLLAAASAFAGGLAVAWFYRGTLARLRKSEVLEEDRREPEPRSPKDEGF